MDRDRDNHLAMARIARQAERYTDMVEFMKKIVMLDTELTVEERNLLHMGYEKCICVLRSSWSIVSTILSKKESTEIEKAAAQHFCGTIKKELTSICNDALTTIQKDLIPTSTSSEAKKFYYTMEGDYYQYLAEFNTDKDRGYFSEHSRRSYQMAKDIANRNLPPATTDHLRTYKIGDYVDVKVDRAVHKGMPDKFYHGRTGMIYNVTESHVDIDINKRVGNRIIKKRIHVPVEHVQPSRCTEEFRQRKLLNQKLKAEAKARGEKIVLKRQPERPKPGFMVEGATMETVTPIPYDVVNDLKGGY